VAELNNGSISMHIDSLKRRAEAGSCAAQAILGLYYLYGSEDTHIDYQEAFRLLSAAARAGASRAVVNLAHMYAQGLGIPRSTTKAVELYESVGKVEFFAAIALGRIYSKGVSVPVDESRAMHWYSIAASFEGRVSDCEELTEAKAYISRSL
jgi:uncharacterized protein